MVSLVSIIVVTRVWPYPLIDADQLWIHGFFRFSNSLISMEEYFLCSFGAHSCEPTHYDPFGGPLARGYTNIQFGTSFNGIFKRDVVPPSYSFLVQEAPTITILMGHDADKDEKYFRYVGSIYRFKGFSP
jgi:hypothetical protein